MARQQSRPIAPPIRVDQQTLLDFSSVVQDNLLDLYNVAHEHSTRTTVPLASEGVVGDMVLVFTSPSWYIYAKVDPSTWLRTAALV